VRGIETQDEVDGFDVEQHPYGPQGGGVPGVVRLVRRRLDVSQRALALRLGVSQSQVARWETGRTSPRAEVLLRLVRMAGLDVVLLGPDGTEEPAMRADGARDRGGRRYPAHVDLAARTWWLPPDAACRADTPLLMEAARRRREPRVTFHTSAWRKHGLRAAFGQPVDHPALHQPAAEVQFRDEQWLERRDALRREVQERIRRGAAERGWLSA
jgi:HTH-type transcriptional regulator/antitoxin HipB